MLKKILILLMFMFPLYAKGETINAGVSIDVQKENKSDVQEFVQKLPKIEKDFIELNYSIEMKDINLLSDEDFILENGVSMPKQVMKTNFVSSPKEYEISLSTGEISSKDNTMENIEYLIKKNPDNRELLFAYSIQLKKEDKLDEALDVAQKALDVDPDYALAHFLKGDILRRMEKFREAADEYLYTTQINPYCADAYYNIAKILELLDDKELALDYYLMAYQANPDDFEIKEIISQNHDEFENHDIAQ